MFVAFNVGCTCKNGGQCIMGLGTYICQCPYGYNGVNCETSTLLLIITYIRVTENLKELCIFSEN